MSKGSISVDRRKVEAREAWSRPTNATKVSRGVLLDRGSFDVVDTKKSKIHMDR